MKARLRGGPHDGRVIDVLPHTDWLSLPTPREMWAPSASHLTRTTVAEYQRDPSLNPRVVADLFGVPEGQVAAALENRHIYIFKGVR